MPTYLFTTQELLDLISKSSAMRSLSAEQITLIQNQIQDPNSEKAQQLYAALLKENQEYRRIDKEFIQNTNNVMTGFENEVRAIKINALHQERQASEAKAQQAQEEAADDILKKL